ncbi:MAG TPA: response regulator transcription factor [Mycobacteriales bacterium]|nr:response regulator transcription factor [Mycobacteriales bacterium]
MRLLVVEDDPAMASVLTRALTREGYAVDAVGTGEEALWAVRETAYDAVVLDAMIPAPDGFEVCRRMRAERRWAPVLLLTARDAIADRVRGLDAGADDYVTKPFALAELSARLRALVRRHPGERPAVLRVGDLALDPARREVRRGDEVVDLSPKEFALLHELMRHPGEVVSRTHLLDHVWDVAYDGTSNIVDVYVRYLREKIDRPFGRSDIETVRGVGYRLRGGAVARTNGNEPA